MVLFVHTLFAMVLMLFVHCCIIHSAICLSHFFLLWGHPEIERKGVHFKNIVVANMNERTRSLVQAIFFLVACSGSVGLVMLVRVILKHLYFFFPYLAL